MIRGVQPVVGRNPFAKEGTPKADFKISRAGLFTIVKTKVILLRADLSLSSLTPVCRCPVCRRPV